MTKATVVPGPFALVTSGNTTTSYLIDGEDIQARADAAKDPYWGQGSTVLKRGLPGYGVQVEGCRYIEDVYTTAEAAERAIQRAIGGV